MNGSASTPSSATMNGTRCAISPAMNATSRESRSSLATMTGHLPARPAASAAASCGPPVERVRALAGLDLDELGCELEALGLGEAVDGGPLGLDAEP